MDVMRVKLLIFQKGFLLTLNTYQVIVHACKENVGLGIVTKLHNNLLLLFYSSEATCQKEFYKHEQTEEN